MAAAAAAAAAAANSESLSSLGTSTTYSSADSVSGYSTPLTSNVTTPAPVDNAKAASTRSTRSSKVEAPSPAVKTRASGTKSNLKADNQSMGASSRATQKNRLVTVPDSEDEDFADDSLNARRIRYDEEVARSLQNELNREVEGILFDDDLEEQPMIDSDSEDYAAADPKGKGKAVATRKASGSRAAAKKRVVQDSDVDEDEDYDEDGDSDFADLAPPAKKQKTAAGSRGKQASAKGKRVAAPLVSDSDDDLPCKSQEITPAPSTGKERQPHTYTHPFNTFHAHTALSLVFSYPAGYSPYLALTRFNAEPHHHLGGCLLTFCSEQATHWSEGCTQVRRYGSRHNPRTRRS